MKWITGSAERCKACRTAGKERRAAGCRQTQVSSLTCDRRDSGTTGLCARQVDVLTDDCEQRKHTAR